jgi:hypothetical protein
MNLNVLGIFIEPRTFKGKSQYFKGNKSMGCTFYSSLLKKTVFGTLSSLKYCNVLMLSVFKGSLSLVFVGIPQ